MKKDDRQLKNNDKQLRSQYFILLSVSIFSLLFLMAADGKAADRSADYPSRPIEYVTHVASGGLMNVIGQVVSDIVQKEKILSQPLVVVSKVGSGAAVAMGYVLEKKGNPYIVLGVASGSFLVTPLLENLPYNYKSFTSIAGLAHDGSVLVVRSDSPFKTAEDIIAEARKRPKELIQGGSSFAGNDSMMGQSIQKLKGVQWNYISFKTEPEALLNVLSGNVHFAMIGPDKVLDHVRAGKVRVLLAAAPDRYPQFKDVPTMKEAGMGESVLTYRGIVGPPNMPDYAVKKLEAAFKKVWDNDRFKKYLEDGAMQPFRMSSHEFSKFLDEENDRWKARLSAVDLLKKK